MNRFTRKQQIAQGIFITLSMLASLADAADLSTEKLRASTSASTAAGAAQPKTAIQNSTASPVATEAQTKKAITQPALTPGAERSLNPQPLPPGGSLIKPMPGASIDMAKPRIDTGIKASPGLIQPATGALGQAATMLSPLPLPPKLSAPSALPAKSSFGSSVSQPEISKPGLGMGNAEIAEISRPLKFVNGGVRNLDLAATSGVAAAASSASPKIYARSTSGISATLCLDKGPPKISEVQGRMKPGGKFMIWGSCFGDRPGHVEISGQFPGGKLKPAVTSWEMTGIELDIPETIRGAGDHSVAVTVVTADGKTSPAMRAQYVAAREYFEVPGARWSPDDFSIPSNAREIRSEKAVKGQTVMRVRINPKCALLKMDLYTRSGIITAINGFEQGLPYEASVTIDWLGEQCVEGKCHVSFFPKASAFCPRGVEP